MLTARLTSRSWSPGTYGRRPNSTPSPRARPVCSPIRRSSSAGTSRGRILVGRGKTSSRSGWASTDAWKPPRPTRPDTRTVPGEYRPHRPGRTTHRAEAASARRNVCAPVPDTSVTWGEGFNSIVISSSGCPGARTIAVIVTSSPSKQREPDSATSTASSPGRCRRGISASAPRAGAASRTNAACPVRIAASSASRAAVARLRVRAVGDQRTGRLLTAGTGAGRAPGLVRPRIDLFMGCCAGRAGWPGPRR